MGVSALQKFNFIVVIYSSSNIFHAGKSHLNLSVIHEMYMAIIRYHGGLVSKKIFSLFYKNKEVHIFMAGELFLQCVPLYYTKTICRVACCWQNYCSLNS